MYNTLSESFSHLLVHFNYMSRFITSRSNLGILSCTAAWQSRIAAKPLQGVLGFLIASYIWFAVPISISTSAGLAYLTMASDNVTSILSPADVDQGKVSNVSYPHSFYFYSDM